MKKANTNNRYVAFLSALIAFVLAAWLYLGFTGAWKYLVGGACFFYGWVSLKTAVFATDKEIEELTTPGEISHETKERLTRRS